MQGQHRINGTWYRWIWTSQTHFPLNIMGCTNDSGISNTARTSPITIQRNIIFGRILEI